MTIYETSRLFLKLVRSAQYPNHWVLVALPPGVKRSRLEAGHSLETLPRSSKLGSIHPLPIRLDGVVLNCLNMSEIVSFAFI
jgi:hypothetical protein